MTGQAASERLVKQPVAPLGSELSVCPLCSRGALWRGVLLHTSLSACLSLSQSRGLRNPPTQHLAHFWAPCCLAGKLLLLPNQIWVLFLVWAPALGGEWG